MSTLRPNLLLLWFVLLCACESTPPLLQPVVTLPPEGGAVACLARVESDGVPKLIAPTRQGLFTLSESGERWDQTQAKWPEPWGRHSPPTRSLMRGSRTFTYPHQELMAQARGALWMLATDPNAQAPRLLWSEDVGVTWKRAALPSMYKKVAGLRDMRPGELRRAPIWSRDTLRLTRHQDTLFVLDDRHVWRLSSQGTNQEISSRSWASIDLRGIDLARTTARDALPASLRHYAPATQARPFELLTVLGDQLMVYRRSEDSGRWTLTSILPTLDRQLLEVGPEVYLLASDAIWHMKEEGERWERIRTPSDADALRHLWLSDQTMLLGAAGGAIWRSPNQGSTWAQVRPQDSEEREITSLLQHGDYVWASTQGAGVLRSGDDGQNWEDASGGMRAARPMAMDMTFDGELLLATDAGLFALGGAPSDGNWNQRHPYATSALSVNTSQRSIHSGTLTGRVVTLTSEGDIQVPALSPLRGRRLELYTPWSSREYTLEAPAILALQGRAMSAEIYAQSSGAGVMFQLENGATWLPLPTPRIWNEVLRGTRMTSMEVAGQNTLYRTSLASGELPAQLWRSDDAGATWRAIRAFEDVDAAGPFQVFAVRPEDPERLTLVTAKTLQHSHNGGVTWTPQPGPWEKDPILVARRQDNALLVLTENRGQLELHRIEDASKPESRETLRMDLNAAGRSPSRVVDVLMDAQFVYLRTGDEVLVSSRNSPREGLPQSVALFLTALLVFVMSTLVFVLLRRWG